jgi:hypothetical protein
MSDIELSRICPMLTRQRRWADAVPNFELKIKPKPKSQSDAAFRSFRSFPRGQRVLDVIN